MWIAKQRRGRCMEHSVHCATRAFIEVVSPTPIHLTKQKLSRKATVGDYSDDEDDVADADVADADLDEDEGDGLDTDFDPKDLLGKILAFVNQVRSSPQARTYFGRLCGEEGITPLQLLKWVRTRWASLYDLITRLLDVRPVSHAHYPPQSVIQITLLTGLLKIYPSC
jgi:hypothetical protein